MVNQVDLEKKINERLEFFTVILEDFKLYIKSSHKADIEYVLTDITKSAEQLNLYYWRLVESEYRPYVTSLGDEDRIHHSKIISATELSIIQLQPVRKCSVRNPLFEYKKDDISIIQVNTMLAWYTSIVILYLWNVDVLPDLDSISNLINEDQILKEFYSEHISWLINLDPQFQYPLISNAHTWKLFEKILLQKIPK